MRNHALMALAVALLFAAPAAAEHPPTVYEEAGLEIPPQAMDFDEENNRFIAHPGWLDGKLIHYYKFRMYVPPNYGTNDGGLEKVPIVPIYLPSSDGTLAGVRDGQMPILAEYPTAGNTAYSDFAQIHFVTTTSTSLDSVEDVMASGADITASDIFANVPVVPDGATLQHPEDPDADAPIMPWTAYYDGEEATTYVFETTSQEFADYANANTRTEESGMAGSGFESVVVPGFLGEDFVSAIPIWHVNQYFTGVTPGVNNGGPADMGQRNIVDLDRLDPGYSPLWQVYWATQVPIGYGADDARSADQIGTGAAPVNGFAIAETPMFVNCPNIGAHGGTAVSDSGADSFGIGDVSAMDTVTIEGSLVMAGGQTVTLMHGDHDLGSATTGMMGAFSFDVPVDHLDAGKNTVTVEDAEGNVVATYTLQNGEASSVNNTVVWIVVVAALLILIYAYGRIKRPDSDD